MTKVDDCAVVLTVPHACCYDLNEQVCDQEASAIARELQAELSKRGVSAHLVEENARHRREFLAARTSFGRCDDHVTAHVTADDNRLESVAIALRSPSSFHRTLANRLHTLERKEKQVILLDVHTFQGEAFGKRDYNLVLLAFGRNEAFAEALQKGITALAGTKPPVILKAQRGRNAITDLYSNLMPTALLEFRINVSLNTMGALTRAVATAVTSLFDQLHRCPEEEVATKTKSCEIQPHFVPNEAADSRDLKKQK